LFNEGLLYAYLANYFYLLKAKDEDKEMEEDKVTIVGRK
jgi:hypothetical protein